MFNSDSRSNKNDILISRVKSQLDQKGLRKIRKALLSLTEMDIKASKSYNVIVIKKEEDENKMARPFNIPHKNYHEDFERIKQNEIKIESEVKIEDKIDFDPSELANSSDFDDESD